MLDICPCVCVNANVETLKADKSSIKEGEQNPFKQHTISVQTMGKTSVRSVQFAEGTKEGGPSTKQAKIGDALRKLMDR